MGMYVKDIDKGIKIIPLFESKKTIIYLFRIHPELTFFQNVRLNFGERISERR